MITHAVYEVDFILSMLRDGKSGKGFFPGNAKLKHGSHRLELFLAKGTDCVTCDAVGAFFRLESVGDETPHFNLYGVTTSGRVALMTKDHILPKSLGGANTLANYQTMCAPCNHGKGSKIMG